jgi:succinate dehydrogenase / fumarate reductase membrane anchor subunit
MSAVALIPLSIWFLLSALSLVGGNLAEVLVFMAEPLNAILMFLFLFAALYHMTLVSV